MTIIQDIDWSILFFIQEHLKSGFMDFVMPLITMLGSAGAIWILSAILLTISKKYRVSGILMLAAFLIALIICNILLKNIIARERPCWLDSDFALLVSNPKDFSFPSGHTLFSALSATMLTMTNKKFALASIPLAVLISFSRLYLYVHFPTDVLCGAVLGIIIGIVVFRAGNLVWEKIKLSRSGQQKDT